MHQIPDLKILIKEKLVMMLPAFKFLYSFFNHGDTATGRNTVYHCVSLSPWF
jgi:hypothetical protein